MKSRPSKVIFLIDQDAVSSQQCLDGLCLAIEGSKVENHRAVFMRFGIDIRVHVQQLFQTLDLPSISGYAKCCCTTVSYCIYIHSGAQQPRQLLKFAPQGSYHQRC